MTEADQARHDAAQKLAEGNVAAALRLAKKSLEINKIASPVVAYPLLRVEAAAQAKGVRELRLFEDAAVASTARLLADLPQFEHWAASWQPPALRLLALERCIFLAPNILLTGTGQSFKLLNDNIGYNNSELCDHLPPEFPGIVASDKQIIVAVRHRETARVNEAALYLPATTNYAAWFFGSLPRLAAYAALGDLGNLPIVLHGDAAPYQLASLAALGIAENRLIRHRANVRLECRELYYCTTSYFHHAHSVTGLNYLRAHWPATAQDGPRKLYLARRNAKDRPLLNEAEVIQLFERYGFTAIDPEAHSVEEQMLYAASAEIIAGPYGANLANLVFARNARKCLILSTKQQPEFARLASALGVACWHVAPQAVKLREGRTLSETMGFTADLPQTEFALNACLAEHD